jgi:hypothetical protein
MAGQLSGGMNDFGAFTSGAKAPLYKATSLMAAIGAMGGYSLGAEELRRLDPKQLTAIARGEKGAMSPALASLGITPEIAAKFLKASGSAPLMEVNASRVGGSAGAVVAAYQKEVSTGGTYQTMVEKAVGPRGHNEKASAYAARRVAKAQEIAGQLGVAAHAAGLSTSIESGTGMFFGQLTGAKGWATPLKGKGVGAAGPAGLEKEAINKQAEVVTDNGKQAKDAADIIKAVNPLELRKKAADSVGLLGSESYGAGINGSVGALIGALQAFAKEISKDTGLQKVK